jgi:putative membrane protein
MLLFMSQWIATIIALWASTYIFNGIYFESFAVLVISALLLGIANSLIKPLLILMTLPLTVLSFGFFLLIINGLVLMLVSSVVNGFHLSGFWTAVFASIFISLISIFINAALTGELGFNKVSKGPWI